MAVSWLNAVSGNWSTGADWGGGVPPNSTTDALIGVAGVYTVTVTGAQAALSLTISDPTATLAVDASAGPASLTLSSTTATSSNAGTLNLIGNATLTGAAFINNGVFMVNAGSAGLAPGGGATFSGALTNSGDLLIGNGATVSAASLNNTLTGTIHLIGDSTNPSITALKIASAAPATWTGFLSVSGSTNGSDGALLQYGSGGINTIATNSSIFIHGPQSFIASGTATTRNSGLIALTNNFGAFDLQAFAAVSTTPGGGIFVNSGTLTVEEGATFTITGTLNDSGSVVIDDVGTDNVSRLATVTANGLTGNGSLSLTGGSAQASLIINGAAPAMLNSHWSLNGDAVVSFASGGITQIGSLGNLLLNGSRSFVALNSNKATSGALTLLASNAGTLRLLNGANVATVNTPFTNTGATLIDDSGNGGSRFTIGGTLTNSNVLNIGNNFILAPTIVTATGLTNTTTINLTGAPLPGGATATLSIAAGAPASLTGHYNLNGDAVLQFGPGAITSIGATGSSSSLLLNSSSAKVNAGSSTNSALLVLKNVSTGSTLTLLNGATLTTTPGSGAAFSNAGTLNVDNVLLAGSVGGSTLTITASPLVNTGVVNIGNAAITGNSTVTVAGLTNNNTINLTGGTALAGGTGQALLSVLAAAPTTWTGHATLSGNAALKYQSGAIIAISSGASLSLDGLQATVGSGATAGNSALATLASNAGAIDWGDGTAISTSAVNFTNTGFIGIDDLFSAGGGSSFTIGGTLTNNGSVTIGNSAIGKVVTVTAATLNNTGGITLAGGGAGLGASLSISANATNSGFNGLHLDNFGGGGSTLTIGGSLTNTGSISVGNGGITAASKITVAGQLFNSGSQFNPGGGIHLAGGNSLLGGTAQAALIAGGAAPSTLTGLVSLSGNSLLQFGSGAITAIGGSGSFGSLSLDGKLAQVNIAGLTTANSALAKLGSNTGFFSLGDGAAVSDGPGAFFTNTGSVNIDTFGGGGSTLQVVGATFVNSGFGGALNIGNAGITAASSVLLKILTNTASINITGGAAAAMLAVNSAAPTSWTGTGILNGTVGGATLQFASGPITSINGTLLLDGKLAQVNDSGVTGNSALKTLGGVGGSGSFTLADGATLATNAGVNFVDAGNLNIDTSGAGGSSLTIGGSLTNSGSSSISVGNAGASAAATITVLGSLALTNSANVTLTGGTVAGGPQTATLASSGANSSTLTGHYTLTGNALLKVGTGAIIAIASSASLSLDGPLARVTFGSANANALTGLTGNAGTFSLADGAALTTTGGFGSTGTVNIDAVPQLSFGVSTPLGGSSLTIGGMLSNWGQSHINIGNASLMTATKVSASSLYTGPNSTLTLTGSSLASASLTINGAAPTVLYGHFNLNQNSSLKFVSGAITTIGNGASLSLDAGGQVSLTTGAATVLATLGAIAPGGTLSIADGSSLTTTTSLTNYSGALNVDPTAPSFANAGNAGGTTLTIGGTLTNNGTGTINIGNSGITQKVTVAATGFVNNGATVNITGGLLVPAVLTASGAAPSTLVGTYNLIGNAFLNFANGAIIAISNGSTLTEFGGGQIDLTTAGTAANSALANLASNAGTVNWGDGTTVTTAASGANFTNTGTLDIDAGLNPQTFSSSMGGSSFTIGGTLINQGSGIITIGNNEIGAASKINAARLTVSATSTINLTGGAAQASLIVNAPTLATWSGNYNLRGNALLSFTSGAITALGGVNGSASVLLAGALAQVNSGAATGNSALTALASIASGSSLSLANGAKVVTTPGATFNNNGTINIDAGGIGGSLLQEIGGTVNNGAAAALNIGNANIVVSAGATVKNLSNLGTINLQGGAAQAGLAVNSAAPSTLTGHFNLNGNALLQFAAITTPPALITAIGSGASLVLSGALARVALSNAPGSNSALTALASNSGTLDLENGASLATTVGLTNAGALDVDIGFGNGGSGLALGGALTNSGSVTIGNSGLGVATIVTAAGLNNTNGFIDIVGNANGPAATLNLTAASSDGGNLTVEGGGILNLGTNTLTVGGSLDFTGGTITGGTGGTLAGAGQIIDDFGTSMLNGVTIANTADVNVSGGTLIIGGNVIVNGALTGTGGAILDFTQPVTSSLTNTLGFQTINLADGGANSLTLSDANFTNVAGGVITVNDGNSGNTINASGLLSHAIIVVCGIGTDSVTGGAGSDIFTAGGKTTMTGGAGVNQFRFVAPGLTNVITDFGNANAPNNEIVFSGAGFGLGLGGTGNPAPLPTTLFNGDGTGTFTTAAQRFSYQASSGNLFFDANGNAAGSVSQVVATLGASVHPASLAVTHLFFNS